MLWLEILRCLQHLRPACARNRTYLWMIFSVAMFCIRPELVGVTSFVRAGMLRPIHYHSLLHFFHTPALSIQRLTALWVSLARSLFPALEVDGFTVCAADGLKIPKEGLKMPAVKSLHTESANNSKPAFIMGHSFQVISLLVKTKLGLVTSIPLIARISEGIVFSNRDQRSLLDKLILMGMEVWPALGPVLLVADAYYCSGKVILPLLTAGHHLITRARSNATAYEPAKPAKRKRGRPKLYGKKVKLKRYFDQPKLFTQANSPVYGETNVTLAYYCVDLLWRPVGRLVRFVLVDHPTRGKLILMSTSLTFEPLTVIAVYGYRFRIEVMFKQAIHTLGVYTYHFWMKAMKPTKKGNGNQFPHHESALYRAAIRRKIDAYHRFVQLGCIAHGLLLHLSVNFPDAVWKNFRSWLRTMRPDLNPSELVVSYALRSSLPEYLAAPRRDCILAKFMEERCAPTEVSGLLLAA